MSKNIEIKFEKIEVTEETVTRLINENAKLEYKLWIEERNRECMYFNAEHFKDLSEHYRKLYLEQKRKNNELSAIIATLIIFLGLIVFLGIVGLIIQKNF